MRPNPIPRQQQRTEQLSGCWQRITDQCIFQKGHTPWNEQAAKDRLFPVPCFLHFPIDIPGILAYAEDADEFVRLGCRDRTGWRRDEWAYGPLFICGKNLRFLGYFPRFLA
jgi:hypothetical protein